MEDRTVRSPCVRLMQKEARPRVLGPPQPPARGTVQPCQALLASKQKGKKSIRLILSVFTMVIVCRVGICLGFFLYGFQFLKIVPRLPHLLHGPGACCRRASIPVLVLLLAGRCDLEQVAWLF